MTDLAETIERVAAQIADADPNDESAADMVPCGDLRALLAAARRVVAMDSTESPVVGRALNALDCDMARASDGVLFSQIESEDLRALLDLAADQSAARARVAELEALARKLLEAADLQKRTGHWVADLATAVAIKELAAAISPEPEGKR